MPRSLRHRTGATQPVPVAVEVARGRGFLGGFSLFSRLFTILPTRDVPRPVGNSLGLVLLWGRGYCPSACLFVAYYHFGIRTALLGREPQGTHQSRRRLSKALFLERGYHWRVTKLLLTAFALGLASLDVTGALAAVGALGAGARVRALMAFGCFSILGTVAFGTALSLIVGPRISGMDWAMLLPHDPTEDRVAASIEVVLGLGLLAWGIVRTRRPTTRPPKPSAPRGLGLLSLTGAGMLFALAAIFDPTFVSLVVIAGRAELFWPVVAAHSTWTLVSHTPLVFVLAFAVSGNHERVVNWFRTWWARISPLIVRLVTGVLLLVGTVFLLDAAWWYVTGEFFIPG